jgi:hypothetical protein
MLDHKKIVGKKNWLSNVKTTNKYIVNNFFEALEIDFSA